MGKASKKSLILLTALALLLCVSVGGTLAYLFDRTDLVKNTFTPAKVTTFVEEKLENGVKKDVAIKNTGDTTAYLRAAVVVTWQNANGDVWGTAPVLNTDYTIAFDLNNGWQKGADGFYYWTQPVAKGASTGVLITTCQPISSATPPEGYALCVEILGSGVQSVPTRVVTAQWDSGVSGISSTDNTTLLIK